MRGFSRRAALLLLLPILAQAIVLPPEIFEPGSQSQPTRHYFDSAGYGGPATFFQYNITDDSIKFTIPCPECSDEEKKAFEQRIIHIKPIQKSTQHCTTADPIGLEINGSPVEATETSSSALQAHTGAFNLGNHTEHHILKHIRWINHCGCVNEHQNDEECEDFESAFSLQYLGLPSGQVPGFTASYKQHGKPELLRFSTFPEIDISNAWKFGQSAHYRSPLLRLQKALSPTTATIISSISNLPSSTTSASLPSYTYYEHNPEIVKESPASSVTTTLSPPGHSVQQKQASSGNKATTVAESKKSHWCHLPNPLTSISHGLELFGMKAKSGAQDVLGKVQNVMSSTQPDLASLHTTSISSPQSTDSVSHDDLNDVVVEDLSPSASTAPSPVVHNEEGFNFQDLPAFKWLKEDPAAASAFKLTCIVVGALGLSMALAAATFSFLRTNSRLRTRLAALTEEDHCNRCYVEVRSSWQEFRTRRLYRRAARKHRFLTFFGLRSACPDEKNIEATAQQVEETWSEAKVSLDYSHRDEEKGALAFRKNLLALRKTHQFVNRIVSGNQAERMDDRGPLRIRHGRSWSFSSEKTAPPAYQSDCEDLILDADGPRFVVIRRGTNGSDASPESSIVSTSPRTSCADSDSEHDEKF